MLKPARSNVVKVLLVCGTGLGTAQLLKERVSKLFPHFVIHDICSVFELGQYMLEDIDLCLTTVPISNDRMKCLHVNPFLQMVDIHNIHAWMANKGEPVESLVEEIMTGAAKLGVYHPDLYKEVKKVLVHNGVISNKNDRFVSRREVQAMLTELLTDKTVEVTESCLTWEQAVQKAGALLLASDGTEERYTQAMMDAIYKHGPYMVMTTGVALLHARPQDGVKKVCMSLQIIKSGVPFGHKERDPVDLVFAFGAIDTSSHLLALTQLMNLLNDEGLLTELRRSLSIEEALETIQKVLQTNMEK